MGAVGALSKCHAKELVHLSIATCETPPGPRETSDQKAAGRANGPTGPGTEPPREPTQGHNNNHPISGKGDVSFHLDPPNERRQSQPLGWPSPGTGFAWTVAERLALGPWGILGGGRPRARLHPCTVNFCCWSPPIRGPLRPIFWVTSVPMRMSSDFYHHSCVGRRVFLSA